MANIIDPTDVAIQKKYYDLAVEHIGKLDSENNIGIKNAAIAHEQAEFFIDDEEIGILLVLFNTSLDTLTPQSKKGEPVLIKRQAKELSREQYAEHHREMIHYVKMPYMRYMVTTTPPIYGGVVVGKERFIPLDDFMKMVDDACTAKWHLSKTYAYFADKNDAALVNTMVSSI